LRKSDGCDRDLPHVVEALALSRRLPRFVQRGEQHANEQRNDPNDDEEFDEGEAAAAAAAAGYGRRSVAPTLAPPDH
jgi:hypothetical protein